MKSNNPVTAVADRRNLSITLSPNKGSRSKAEAGEANPRPGTRLPTRPPLQNFATLLSVFLTFLALDAAPAQTPKPAETQWPKITAEIFQITRIPGDRVAARFLFRSSAAAPRETLIADKVFPVVDDAAWEAFAGSLPFSLEGSTLTDEGEGVSYPPAARLPGEPRPGRSYKKTVLPPSSEFIIGLIFKCPPVNQDDPPKKQFVSFQLPGLRQPITGVPLPRGENQTIQFQSVKAESNPENQ